jgi:drug/metabolite transporter (DMT)-like permease
MVFLALAVVCSTGIAVIFKLTEGRFDRVALLTVNYAAALSTAAILLSLDPPTRGLEPEAPLALLGITLGALFIAGFALFSKAIGLAGISLATATMRLSVALPFLASWLIWNEVPTAGQSVGLIIAGVAFVLISRPSAPASAGKLVPGAPNGPQAGNPLATFLILALLFVAGGLVDTSFKLFEEEFSAESSRSLFLLLVFGIAFLIGATMVVIRRFRTGVWPAPAVLGWGTALGVVNYGSAEFILLALQRLPGTVVFPANNVAVVALATLLGIVFWREHPGRANILGLVLAIVALIMLAL